MHGTIAPYIVAFFAMAFAGISALALIRAISRLDPPDVESPREPARPTIAAPEKIAV